MVIRQGAGNGRSVSLEKFNERTHLRRSMRVAHHTGNRCRQRKRMRSRCPNQQGQYREQTWSYSLHRVSTLVDAPTALSQKSSQHGLSSRGPTSGDWPTRSCLARLVFAIVLRYSCTMNGALSAICCLVTPSFTLMVTVYRPGCKLANGIVFSSVS